MQDCTNCVSHRKIEGEKDKFACLRYDKVYDYSKVNFCNYFKAKEKLSCAYCRHYHEIGSKWVGVCELMHKIVGKCAEKDCMHPRYE